VLQAIRQALEAVNAERPEGEKIAIHDETALLGRSAQLDSLAFVNFVVDLEGRLRESTGKDFVLVGDLAGESLKAFRNASTLADHIVGMAAQST
jgi:hypothetical protein